MSMNEKPDFIAVPALHYAFIEKSGPFHQTARACWEELHKQKADLAKHNQITGVYAMYKIDPPVYRAGFTLGENGKELPSGVSYMHFDGGAYIRFTVTGSYEQMPEACGRAMEIVKQDKLEVSDNWYLEHYVNDPATTKEEQLQTEILVPTNKSAVPAK